MADGNYTVVVDGQKFSVQVVQGEADIQILPTTKSQMTTKETTSTVSASSSDIADGTKVSASVNGNVWKILVNVGDQVNKGDTVTILEAMKMEIEIEAPCDGVISSIEVKPNDLVEEGQTIVIIN